MTFAVGSILGVMTLFGLFAVSTPASAMTCNSATLTGTVDTGTPPARARFEYSTNYNTVANDNGITTPVQVFDDEGTFHIQQFISGLSENTTYYYRLVVTNDWDTAELNIENFTTPPCNTTPPPPPAQDPHVDLIARPDRVNYNGSSTLEWSTSNASSCTASGGPSNWSGSKNTGQNITFHTGNLTNTETYSITCYGANGTRPDTDTATVTVGNQPNPPPPPPPPTPNPNVNLTANPTSVSFNGSSMLSWTVSNASSCNASGGTNGWSGPKNTGSNNTFFTGNLTSNTTYSITCYGANGASDTDTATVTVGNQTQICQDPTATNYGGPLPCVWPGNRPTVTISADDTSIDDGDSTIVRWTSSNATSCTGSGGANGWAGSRNLSSSFFTGALTSDRTFSITCFNNNGSDSDSVTIRVDDDNDDGDVSVNLTADDTSIDEGDDTTVRWTANNATSCTGSGGANGWSGRSLNTSSGTFNTGDLSSDRTFSITCRNNSDSANDSVTIRVDDDNDNDDDDISVNITADDTSLNEGDRTTVRWNSDNADECEASGGANGWSGRNIGTSGTFNTGSLFSTRTFHIVCTNDNSNRSANDSVTIRVDDDDPNPVPDQPDVIIYADSTNIAYNSSTTIRWGSINATSCNASGGSQGWTGPKSTGPGSFFTGSLTSSRTYSITCSNNVGSDTDSVTITVRPPTSTPTPPRVPPTSLVIISSSIDRNQKILPTLDNTSPKPGDEILYTVTYQNIGTGSITNLVLRIDLPNEVDYLFSNPSNPSRNGNTLIFSLGTLRANGEGTVTVRTRVRENIPAGTNLNFPAVLSYVDPSGFPQTVTANVSAQVWTDPAFFTTDDENRVLLGANVFGAGFFPSNIFGWLILIILILLLMLLTRYLFGKMVGERTIVVNTPPNPPVYPH